MENGKSNHPQLKLVSENDITSMRFDPVDPIARDQSAHILNEVKSKGLDGLINQSIKLGDLESSTSKYLYDKKDLEKAFASLDEKSQVIFT
jgi:hypothetical protein